MNENDQYDHKDGAWVADTGLFIACGRQQNTKHTALERFAQRNEITFVIPQRVYGELGGAPEPSTPGQLPITSAIDAGWVTVADDLDYTNPTVATVMDDVRSYIAHAANRPEDQIEKADAALAGVAVQLLEQNDILSVSVVTTDTDAGRGVAKAIETNGFPNRIEIIDGFELVADLTGSR